MSTPIPSFAFEYSIMKGLCRAKSGDMSGESISWLSSQPINRSGLETSPVILLDVLPNDVLRYNVRMRRLVKTQGASVRLIGDCWQKLGLTKFVVADFSRRVPSERPDRLMPGDAMLIDSLQGRMAGANK